MNFADALSGILTKIVYLLMVSRGQLFYILIELHVFKGISAIMVVIFCYIRKGLLSLVIPLVLSFSFRKFILRIKTLFSPEFRLINHVIADILIFLESRMLMRL